ncbi:GIY-YIG nuclease family protein [Levilactobacillus suantsaii]|uniref:GIY-YIG nuclease family protein n=1 Tax=Levilactobacillus suantsaii TaxID=2292255 RepID=UPI001CDB858E|nr:GIY-YIG nuclease family protein [Levilactobacillus suantsaii]
MKDEIAKLQEELSKYHEQEDEVDYREQHATAGYVYIISNIGSFGKNVFKIGVTRRLEPMDRINELSSASVPFKFDVHALIFSEDAYKLEAELHNRFTNRRINKVNNRKEYFSISIEDVENELKKYKNVTVDFKERPEADEYRETLALENNS